MPYATEAIASLQIANHASQNHASTRTTQLYDRRPDEGPAIAKRPASLQRVQRRLSLVEFDEPGGLSTSAPWLLHILWTLAINFEQALEGSGRLRNA